MLACFVEKSEKKDIPIEIIPENQFNTWFSNQKDFVKNWLLTLDYKGKDKEIALIPNNNGELEKVILAVGNTSRYSSYIPLVSKLPGGVYSFPSTLSSEDYEKALLGWGLASYRFTRYKSHNTNMPKLLVTEKNSVLSLLEAMYLVRDLINTPTEDMGPEALAQAAISLANQHKAAISVIEGEELHKGFPLIHAVGRASDEAPRLIDFVWGNEKDPKVTLVGKGVCFDTGGLNLKSGSNMELMKKDMGGGAHVLGMAHYIMSLKLPIRLRVLIPAVENAVSGNAYRPGDVIPSRAGLSVEIGNTDAEGRLILADALNFACEENPDILLDFATLTGAARVALGLEIPALFSNNDSLAQALLKSSEEMGEALWQMPLYKPYRKLIDSNIAHINNNSAAPYGGAITAALFLNEFVNSSIPWAHVDMMAWNKSSSSGLADGAEAMLLQTTAQFLKNRYMK